MNSYAPLEQDCFSKRRADKRSLIRQNGWHIAIFHTAADGAKRRALSVLRVTG